jgi:hypothetical protein
MRRGVVIVAVIVTILAGIGIGVGAYRAGEENGIAQGIEQVQDAQATGQEVQVVHVVDDGPRGFFPGFFLFPLFLIGGFVLIGALARGGRWGRGPWGRGPWGPGPGPWNDEGRRRFEERAREWHRHEHGEAAPPGSPPPEVAGA